MRRYGRKNRKKFKPLRDVVVRTADRKDNSVRNIAKTVYHSTRAWLGLSVTKEQLAYWYDPDR